MSLPKRIGCAFAVAFTTYVIGMNTIDNWGIGLSCLLWGSGLFCTLDVLFDFFAPSKYDDFIKSHTKESA
jgi:hypothetical protein